MMSFFLNDLDPEQLVILASALSLNFSKGLTPSEIEILGGFLTSIGDLLALIASKQATESKWQYRFRELHDIQFVENHINNI